MKNSSKYGKTTFNWSRLARLLRKKRFLPKCRRRAQEDKEGNEDISGRVAEIQQEIARGECANDSEVDLVPHGLPSLLYGASVDSGTVSA